LAWSKLRVSIGPACRLKPDFILQDPRKPVKDAGRSCLQKESASPFGLAILLDDGEADHHNPREIKSIVSRLRDCGFCLPIRCRL
jgi:hypothetical protein